MGWSDRAGCMHRHTDERWAMTGGGDRVMNRLPAVNLRGVEDTGVTAVCGAGEGDAGAAGDTGTGGVVSAGEGGTRATGGVGAGNVMSTRGTGPIDMAEVGAGAMRGACRVEDDDAPAQGAWSRPPEPHRDSVGGGVGSGGSVEIQPGPHEDLAGRDVEPAI